MKAECLELVQKESDSGCRLNVLREYLQALILFSFHQSEAFVNLSFVGGTALRFLYRLPRFSEDLYFSLETKNGYKPVEWLKKLKRDLELMGYEVEVTWDDERFVHTGWIKFKKILSEVKLSVNPNQKLSIKIEVDSNPPRKAKTEIKIIQLHRMIALRHHSLSCLMAGKIRAILTRPYAKGRDWYDLLWYLSQVPPTSPDLNFLKASMSQNSKELKIGHIDWKKLLSLKLESLSAISLQKDVAPFLENENELKWMSTKYLKNILSPE